MCGCIPPERRKFSVLVVRSSCSKSVQDCSGRFARVNVARAHSWSIVDIIRRHMLSADSDFFMIHTQASEFIYSSALTNFPPSTPPSETQKPRNLSNAERTRRVRERSTARSAPFKVHFTWRRDRSSAGTTLIVSPQGIVTQLPSRR